jgi:hypothetical protein
MPPTCKRQHAAGAYQKVKARAKARSAAVTLAGQDIGGLPPIADRVRRGRADRDLNPACLTAVRWAIFSGQHQFVYLIASTNEAALA